MSSMIIYDTIIVGAGPAGIGAATQAKKNGLNFLLLEKNRIGGRIRLAYKVDNLITPKPISGVEIVKIFLEMLKSKQISVKIEEVKRIRFIRYMRHIRHIGHIGHIYEVCTNSCNYYSKSVIIATGLLSKQPEIRGIKRAIKNKIVFFDWQSLKKVYHSPVIIIGGGEVGFDSACSLKKAGFELTVITRSQSPDINPYLSKEVTRLSIPIIKGVRYKSILIKDKVVELSYQKDGVRGVLPGKSILLTIGGVPNTSIIDHLSREKGIFVCGDANKFNLHQAAIAFGDGVNTAMKVTKFLRE